ncbi:FMN-binding negative transcriptional regulator [Niveispirillum fermenti]|uniref:FMN-binding negative transcriptional regulator n=1 Tax=Niveispirillum fermenti TaxID=1233113 RepID=UPI003A8787FD
MGSVFETYGADDVRRLIEQYPLAWVSSPDGEEASLLPLVGVYDAGGGLIELIGHFARSNPLAAVFATDPRAVILFKGPDDYISPSQAGRRDWGPTWNYVQLRVWADITVDPALTPAALDMLIDQVERDRPQPWRAAELGPRYDLLIPHIVGFRARVTRQKAKFKLGQDERPDTLRNILSTLPDGGLPDGGLADWMRRFNPDRLGDGNDE